MKRVIFIDMKAIETLLQRYHDGSITPDEMDELNRLTHREDVIQMANAKATSIRRRRNGRIVAVASVLLVAGVFFAVFTNQGLETGDEPLIAKVETHNVDVADLGQSAAVEKEDAQEHVAVEPMETELRVAAEPVIVPERTMKAVASVRETVKEPLSHTQREVVNVEAMEIDPIVACNTQCSPDSVINDIWNFLKA